MISHWEMLSGDSAIGTVSLQDLVIHLLPSDMHKVLVSFSDCKL